MTEQRSDEAIRADLVKRGERAGPFPADGVQAALRRLGNDVEPLLAERDSLRGVVQAARELHRPNVGGSEDHGWCKECGKSWPCPTVAALAAAADAPQPADDECEHGLPVPHPPVPLPKGWGSITERSACPGPSPCCSTREGRRRMSEVNRHFRPITQPWTWFHRVGPSWRCPRCWFERITRPVSGVAGNPDKDGEK